MELTRYSVSPDVPCGSRGSLCASASQGTCFKRISKVGSFRLIPRQTTILHAETTLMERLHGSFKAAYSRNGKQRVLSYGSMVNVRISSTFLIVS